MPILSRETCPNAAFVGYDAVLKQVGLEYVGFAFECAIHMQVYAPS